MLHHLISRSSLRATVPMARNGALHASKFAPSITALRGHSLMATKGFATQPKGMFEELVAADQTLAQAKFYHKTNMAVMVLTPIALVAHPSPLSMPIDIALSILFPIHAHIGMNWIFTDYVPVSPTGPARIALLACSVLACLGLLRLSLTGDGITGSLKALWKPPVQEEKGDK